MSITTTTSSTTILDRSFAPQSRQINYMNRDFDSFKQSLINFSKQYYAKTYQDFNEASPGMMFIEQASYVGDVISFYNDYLFKESLFDYASERKNVVRLASYLSYTPKPVRPSVVDITVSQLVPAIMGSDGIYIPNLRYAFKIRNNMMCSSDAGVSFITTNDIDFSVNSINSPRTDSVYRYDSNGNPTFYLLQKTVRAYSGELHTERRSITTAQTNIVLPDTNVIKIISVVDEDNNKWYNVDFLAQDLVMMPVENNNINFSENYYQYSDTVPNIIRFLRTDRRYVIKVDENNFTHLQFGPSTDNIQDQVLIPSSTLIGPGFSNLNKYNLSLNPTFYMNSPSYGTAPSNTTLTITYVRGGGIESNVPTNSIKTISSIEYQDTTTYLPSETTLVNTLKGTISVNNQVPATGGSGEESVEEIKMNALSMFSAQNRAVTSYDYTTMLYSMPEEFGKVAKVYVSTEANVNVGTQKSINGLLDSRGNVIIDDTNKDYRKISMDSVNPFGINVYMLSYDNNKQLIQSNDALIHNVKNYMYKYRIASDRINIIDGYVVNIGVNFSILTYSNYNKREVLSNCINAVKNFFNTDKWQFMQPINLSQLQLEIANIEGVQSIASIEIVNLTSVDGSGTDYSLVEYDINSATKNNIIYPPTDISIFEVKYPDTDIKGQVVS